MTRRRYFVLVLVALVAVVFGGRGRLSAADGDCLVIDDFSKARIGEQPSDWKLRKDSGKGIYTVQEENGRRFLHAASRGLGIQLAKEYEWDLKAYPVLAWSWRAVEFPKGSDERESKGNDSAASVYLLVPYSKIRGPKAVKYIWSERVPAGTRLTSNGGLTQATVVRSGTEQGRSGAEQGRSGEKKGEWVEERMNVRDDFLKFFNEKDVPKPAGIAVLTDSDDTNSSAQGDYANFRVCRN